MDVDTLPYDDEEGAKYAEAHPEQSFAFKNRIGAGRLYLLAESSAASLTGKLRQGKERKTGEEEEMVAIEEDETTTAEGVRKNAILFRGEPISNLPTQRIFAYVSNCGTTPLGLEWVDDTNVVLVWQSVAEAKDAYQIMREAGTLEQDEDDEGFVPAKPMPETLWPMEMRLEKALGRSIQEQGQMWMRWARPEDVKQKGGRTKSRFYEKYGDNAGKEGQNLSLSGTKKKRNNDNDADDLRRRLDAELDTFAEGDESTTRRRSISPRRGRSASPPPRDRNRRSGNGRRKWSDYDYDSDLKARLGPPVASANRGVREWDVGKEWQTDEFGRSSFGRNADGLSTTEDSRETRRGGRGYRRGHRDGVENKRESRPAVTKEDLDAELDAFLQS